jgi:hypothetical protein
MLERSAETRNSPSNDDSDWIQSWSALPFDPRLTQVTRLRKPPQRQALGMGVVTGPL